MNKDGNTFDKGFRKSAKSVGNIMGNYHPHGDSSIYEAMVRLSQDWKLREVLMKCTETTEVWMATHQRRCVIQKLVYHS